MRINSIIKICLLMLFFSLMVACTSNESGKSSQEPQEMILATTTSTQDSGLLDVLVPMFEEEHNITVKTIAVGTGKALSMGENGEADALLTHAPVAEEVLVENNDVINKKRVMFNDFVIVGPEADPAGIDGLDVLTALQNINEANATFVSRGDDSGTHKKELSLWAAAELEAPNGDWYLESGQGMGNTLQLSAEKEGYVLTDRATYLAHQNNYQDMVILVEGEDVLLNIYHVMQVNSEKHELVNGEAGKLFVEFMVSDEAQAVIKEFGIEEYGQPLFFQYTE